MKSTFLLSLVLSGFCFAGEIPRDPNTIMPPGYSCPQCTLSMTFTDEQTTMHPRGDLDTMLTQSTGTYNDQHPTSHPIPLDQ